MVVVDPFLKVSERQGIVKGKKVSGETAGFKNRETADSAFIRPYLPASTTSFDVVTTKRGVYVRIPTHDEIGTAHNDSIRWSGMLQW